ncbi:MAG: endopeptidase La [Candidatus Doudnabacteria bacterium RIFCSPHIGHO2_02_FULL_46_11]|uniref:endopeptidase La n=1 Tax=Candidatus Doudnabacteria bacterium RIFCSPHIGHO2_02_FULL_46_11 TaxID=1817832 RepID=A0A1F5P496_9BACT|nr:MAG: endopeptidase La [Candidatus Doudnabacteria bacterium RIFCSPHIGHO2_02_FULL_46_11]
MEYLAVQKLNSKLKGPILCFFGPPGVGKTSIGQSIAKALNRKFVRMSLGGIRDEAEIRGHRRTYVGALPGRIIQGIKNAGTKNPVFMLDEIDKVGTDFRGDPASALLEALDPEQNNSFSDHYLEVPFDLSQVLFVTTANTLDTIPAALRDRLEVIEFTGYTIEEKEGIGRQYLWPKVLVNHGLDGIAMGEAALRLLVTKYTREAGVRNLERQLATVARKLAKKKVEEKEVPAEIEVKTIHASLGAEKFPETLSQATDEVGVATGLAWTQVGGEILFIEANLMPGKGNLILTGQLGEIMKESAQAALSYVRSRARSFNLDEHFLEKRDIHVHVPAGAIPKDGPSAGIAIAAAIASAVSRVPLRKEVGLTGEVTIRGRALEIGGLKEKIIAASRAGVSEVIIPADNEKNLEDVPLDILKKIKIHFVNHMDEVLPLAFVATPPAKRPSRASARSGAAAA